MSQEEDFARGFIKGFEEGLKDAWEEIIKLSTKGYTSRELQIMAKTKKSMLFQVVQQKAEELERVMGKRIFSQAVPPKPPTAQPELRPGWSYVIKEDRPEKSFSIFTTLIGGGGRGLCISRTHPDTLKQKYGFVGFEQFTAVYAIVTIFPGKFAPVMSNRQFWDRHALLRKK